MSERVIKFRAWDKDNLEMVDNIQSKIGYLFRDFLNHPQRFEVMQFTGLKDKNGKEIYEGDITNHGEIVWFDDEALEFVGWHIRDLEKNKYGHHEIHAFFTFATSHEIIGNIHENPELLEVK